MRWIVFGLFVSLFPWSTVVAADAYANSLLTYGGNVLTPGRAVGAPDGAYADFIATDGTITFDLGESEEGTGNVILHYYLLNYGATPYISLLRENQTTITTLGNILPTATTEVEYTYTGSEAYRYVRVTTLTDHAWKLDAIEVTAYEGDTATEELEEETSEDTEADDASEEVAYTVGTLLKIEDNAAVYILGSDGYRHAFPTESAFTSWGLSFDDVVTVDAAVLASFSLGRNVTIRPGTYLVKLQTNPKVYAVEPGGVLRWVSSEVVALQLYGVDWASRVIDVSDAFWANYSVGDDVDSAVHPDGVLIEDDGTVYYVADAAKAALTDDEIDELRVDEAFLLDSVNNTILAQYLTTESVLLLNGVTWPF